MLSFYTCTNKTISDTMIMHHILHPENSHSLNNLSINYLNYEKIKIEDLIGYNKKNQSVTIQINNIFNKEYYNHLSKIKAIMPEAGRNVVVSYKVFF